MRARNGQRPSSGASKTIVTLVELRLWIAVIPFGPPRQIDKFRKGFPVSRMRGSPTGANIRHQFIPRRYFSLDSRYAGTIRAVGLEFFILCSALLRPCPELRRKK